MNQEVEQLSRPPVSDRSARFVLAADRLVLGLARHWVMAISIVLSILVLAPFAAPALVAAGIRGPANAIYFIYSLLCHQLPERSYFLFGPKISYSLAEISRVWKYDNLLNLRQFIGNASMGWKVAWSDRMVSLYGGAWIASILYALSRRRLPRLSPAIWLLVGVLPIAVDGFSHMINDALAGVSGTGFRDTNAWLQFLTGNVLPATFYVGDAFGSFNSLTRLVTGLLFGMLTVWFIYPIIDNAMSDIEKQTSYRLSTPRAQQLGFRISPELEQKGQI